MQELSGIIHTSGETKSPTGAQISNFVVFNSTNSKIFFLHNSLLTLFVRTIYLVSLPNASTFEIIIN